jgi:hypothetical protein
VVIAIIIQQHMLNVFGTMNQMYDPIVAHLEAHDGAIFAISLFKNGEGFAHKAQTILHRTDNTGAGSPAFINDIFDFL